ncbi:dynamin family protein [Arthrobacter sp.]|uniref:dynamin family protein n=1 Tax=Arthrobacter sp. TaxID=1667 RepID=UPI003A9377D4
MTTNEADREAAGAQAAVGLLKECRVALEGVRLPLDLPGAADARIGVARAIEQLDDYILPRYRTLDAPLLAVVGGSTGAGKSTLVNAIVGRPVTRAGAIRPTTRQPILLHHPTEAEWFLSDRVLPNLGRITGTPATDGRLPGAGGLPEHGIDAGTSLVVLEHEAIPAGIALLDAPDIDSVSDANRQLAGQLLSAADLWLFVTTANRYADAVPWKLLADAAARDITVAVILDRVPEGVEEEISSDLRNMLARQGLDAAELFVIPEAELNGKGMLPAAMVTPIRQWLTAIAEDAAERATIARRTLAGAVSRLGERSAGLALAEQQQHDAGARLSAHVAEAYEAAIARIGAATHDGTLLRGEVLARWQDFVGTGEFFRSLESGIGRLRDRIGAFFNGRPQPVEQVEEAIETGLHAVIIDEAAKAAEQTDAFWQADPAARRLLGDVDLGSVTFNFGDRVAAEIRDWQGDLMEIIRSEGAGKRFTARMVSFGINGVAVALMIVVFASTAGLTGLEVGIAGGSAIVGQKLLEAIFGEDAVRRLAKQAREKLDSRVQRLLAEESTGFLDLLTAVPTPAGIAELTSIAQRLDALTDASRGNTP